MSHPYYPTTLTLPHYLPNDSNTLSQITIFSLGLILLSIPALYFTHSKSLKYQLTFLWFLLSGSIHLFFEAYFVIFNQSLASHKTLFGQLWKEYSLADSRYLSSDPLVLFIEGITAFLWGPLCYLICYQLFTFNSQRHLYIIIVSLGQLYGVILYYLTALYENTPHCVPNSFYFYGYFIFTNSFWFFIPMYYLYDSGKFILLNLKEYDNNNDKNKLKKNK
ncbi:3-beta-hydroxysteroid-Delta(8),Delta(7)-isomerase [Neoconidiobolus thromboides FSU 785]|nr:3-beta-hydroxysteroid-Delta(8),Delta(7)-isomerase [Neoconidiobolus thromboides FSU 785]